LPSKYFALRPLRYRHCWRCLHNAR